jgi:hypothetical protein
MLTTHESMRLPRLSEGSFHFWKAIELTARQPRFLLTVAFRPSSGEVDMLFSLDQEVISFLAEREKVTPRALHVLVPQGFAGSSAWQVLPVERIELHRAGDATDDPLVVLRLFDGQAVRAVDLAPVRTADADIVTLAEFPLAGTR